MLRALAPASSAPPPPAAAPPGPARPATFATTAPGASQPERGSSFTTLGADGPGPSFAMGGRADLSQLATNVAGAIGRVTITIDLASG